MQILFFSYRPTLCRSRLGNLGPSPLIQLLSPRLITQPAKLLSGLVFAVAGILLDLARADLGNLDSRTDGVGGSLLAFRTFSHWVLPRIDLGVCQLS